MLYSNLTFLPLWFMEGFGQIHGAREYTGEISGGTRVKLTELPFHPIKAPVLSLKIPMCGGRGRGGEVGGAVRKMKGITDKELFL